MIQHVTIGRLAATFALTLVVSSTGCQSKGGSRWAWNPWSRSAGTEAAAFAESSAPKLPSAGATPLVEGLPKAKPQAAMIAQAKAQTPPAMAGIASTLEAVNAAVPKIDKPAPSSPSWSPKPTSVASAPTAPPMTPPASAMASMPYDPNGYKPSAPSASSPASTDRYGLSNRYAAATPPADNVPAFGEMPALPTNPTTGGRYGMAAPVEAVAAAVPAAKETMKNFTNDTQKSANNVVASVGSRYGEMASSATAASPFGSIASPAPTTVAQATSIPAPVSVPSAAPAYPTSGYPTPAYPTTKGFAAATPAAAPVKEGSSLGTLPPAAPASKSVYASTTPITPIERATANTTPAEEAKSVVRLTTLPGEYRPGGTSTYRATSSSSSTTTSRY